MPPSHPQRLESAIVGEHRIFDVVRHLVTYPPRSASEGPRELQAYCLRMPDWVTVAAFTTHGKALLVRQHRHGIDDVVLETPGGIIDPGEDPLTAAARELREETGFRARHLESLGWVHPNPAIQDNRLHLMLACDVERVGSRILDEHEDTEPVEMGRAELWQQLRAGAIRHALSALCLERAFARLAESNR